MAAFTGRTQEEYYAWLRGLEKKRYGVVMHSGGEGYVVRELEADKDVFRDSLYHSSKVEGGKTWTGTTIPKNAEKYANKLNGR